MESLKDCFFSAITNRRSYYSIGKEKIVSNDNIIEMVQNSIKYAPSAFNSQTSRVVLLFDKNHERLWDIVLDELKKIISPENFEISKQKIETCFKNGYGTVLYFEDQNGVKTLQEQYPLYKEHFEVWSNHASAILQFIIWTALETAGLGATLQHYNPLIDESVKKEWNILNEYKLIAQMPFGNPLASPDEKTFLPIEERFKVFD